MCHSAMIACEYAVVRALHAVTTAGLNWSPFNCKNQPIASSYLSDGKSNCWALSPRILARFVGLSRIDWVAPGGTVVSDVTTPSIAVETAAIFDSSMHVSVPHLSGCAV